MLFSLPQSRFGTISGLGGDEIVSEQPSVRNSALPRNSDPTGPGSTILLRSDFSRLARSWRRLQHRA